MGSPSPDDELLSILLTNLRNAAATFGEGTPPYESIKTTIEDHLQAIKAQGSKTNLTGVRQLQSANGLQQSAGPSTGNTLSFANLAFRPKPT